MDFRHYTIVSLAWFALSVAAPAAANIFDGLERLTDGLGLGGAAREFLDPEEAFRFSYEMRGNGSVDFTWEIAPGYYLYRDKITAESKTVNVIAAEPQRPAGEMKEDPGFGRVEIYRDRVIVPVPVSFQAAQRAGEVEVTYQGCAEDGICYPPIKKTVALLFDAIVPRAQAQGQTGAPVLAVQSELSAAGRIAARLGGGSTLTAIGMFFVFGLFLALTPCVFPMVPILSGIIVGQQQPVTVSRGLSLSAVYVLGMAATYACVGLVAGLFGHNLQAAFQHPAVLLAFSAVFALLALSMFGFYDLRIPAGIQSRLDRLSQSKGGGTLIGVAIMGVLSAIIVGPCVAPPLAGALLYLGHQGDPLVGGTALFVLGLGMGAPLLLIGASAGKLLPRAGEWMVVVQRVFGVILLGVAVWFLERVIGSSWAMLLWGGLAVGAAIYMGALDSLDGVTSGWPRLWKGVGIVMLCYGLTMIVGASAGGEDPLRPLAAFAQRGADSPELEFLPIKGLGGFDEQITAARAAGKPVLLDFYADWCIECKHLERETFADEQIKLRLADVVLLRADVTANDADDQALLKNFELFGPPAVLFFDTQGTERRAQRLLGFMGPSDFGSLIEQVYDR